MNVDNEYVVTFFTNPDETGEHIHIYTWAADSPEQAVEFATRQLEMLGPVTLHPGTPQPIARSKVGSSGLAEEPGMPGVESTSAKFQRGMG
jgi:hypothetical protein